MKVAGLVPFTTIDFPEKLAAVIFFQGCPLRCPFCHNPNLQPTETSETLSWEDIISFLKERKKRLDGVVLSGGEPLIQSDILDVVKEIKSLGFQVALHTSGVYPKKLEEILPYLDWIGLDVKAPSHKYHLLTGKDKIHPLVLDSLKLIKEKDIPFEVRTTLDPRYLTIDDVFNLADEIKSVGIQTYALQKYRTFDGDKNPPSQFEIDQFFENEELISYLKKTFKNIILR